MALNFGLRHCAQFREPFSEYILTFFFKHVSSENEFVKVDKYEIMSLTHHQPDKLKL